MKLRPHLFLLLFVLTGCSNPFSGRAAPLEDYRTKNYNCNLIQFQQEMIDPAQIRNTIHCLNSNHDLEALEQLAHGLSDQSLLSFTRYFNETVNTKPKTIFALNQEYLRLERTGELKDFETIAQEVLGQKNAPDSISALLKEEAPLISSMVQSSPFEINTKNLYTLTQSTSYQRLISENYNDDFLTHFIATHKKYVDQKDATTLLTLYQIMSEHGMDRAWQQITKANPKIAIQKLASFFEWLFQNHRYSILSKSIRDIETKNITCFKNQTQVKNPLNTALQKLATLSSSEARTYLTHDVRNLILVSRGYCSIPYSMDSLFSFLDEVTARPEYEEIYALVSPLILDSRFIHFMGSQAAETWVSDNEFLTQHHLFIDLFTLVTMTQDFPISNNGAAMASGIDDWFRLGSTEKMISFFHALQPLFNEKNEYASKITKLFYQMASEFPSLAENKIIVNKDGLQDLIQKILESESLTDTIKLTSSLMDEHKLIPFIDQVLIVFQNFVDRGKTNLIFGTLSTMALDSHSVFRWKIEKAVFNKAPIRQDLCLGLSVDWQFNSYSPNQRKEYLDTLNTLLRCLNPGQTFASLHDLVVYSSQKNSLPFLIKTQESLISEAMPLDSTLAVESIHALLQLDKPSYQSIKQYSRLLPTFIGQLKEPFLASPLLRKMISNQFEKPLFYSALTELIELLSRKSDSSDQNSSAAQALKSMDVLISRTQTFKNVELASGVRLLFDQFCPSVDPRDKSCAIDDDQVELYRQSPVMLSEAIKNEYLMSSQSWIHPKLAPQWIHSVIAPTKVNEFEYHLNPFLQLLKQGPSISESIFKSVQLIQNQRQDLNSFFKERATRLQLIPYIYQVPDYPLFSKKEFHNRMRLRIASDLDRLELLAINADFKAFKLTHNFGMKFIREIALAWGDEPASSWPKSLSKYKDWIACDPALAEGDSHCVRSMKQVKNYIASEMNMFDKGILQKAGECDPRERSGFGKWIQARFCNNEISDMSARVFNLRYLTSLIEKELPEKDGGNDGMRLLRDLFFGLYSNNQHSQVDQFTNGVNTDESCLNSARISSNPNPACNKDNLTLIARFTRMGLIHKMSLAFLNRPDSSVTNIIQILNKVSRNRDQVTHLSEFLSTKSATQLIEDGTHFAFTTLSSPSDDLASLAQTLSTIPNQNWIDRLIDLLGANPEVISKQSPLLETLLNEHVLNAEQFYAFLSTHPASSTSSILNDVSAELTPELMKELSILLNKLEPKQETLTQVISSLNKVEPIFSTALRQNSVAWLKLLAQDRGASIRPKVSQYLLSDDFNQFCDVFSDSPFVSKTYIFLESLHQNPDSLPFFQSLHDFLNQH